MMEFTNLLDAKNRHKLREWLINNHDKEKECWVIVKRCRRMECLELMTNTGRTVLPYMSSKGFVIDKDIEKALKADAEVWNNFQKFPSLYQRVHQKEAAETISEQAAETD